MKDLASLMTARPKMKRGAPHEKAAAVDEIVAYLKEEKVQKSYAYWLSLVKRSGASFGDVMGIVKKAKELPAKYNRGGYVTNRLKALSTPERPIAN